MPRNIPKAARKRVDNLPTGALRYEITSDDFQASVAEAKARSQQRSGKSRKLATNILPGNLPKAPTLVAKRGRPPKATSTSDPTTSRAKSVSKSADKAAMPPPPSPGSRLSRKVAKVTAEAGPGPDVSLAVSAPGPVTVSVPASIKKSTLGAKKVGGKKPGGLGAKKGLGAQKAAKDFAEIEREAEMADNVAVMRKEEATKSVEDQEASMVSMRLAVQDIETQQKKNDQAMSRMDPKKAQQMERLGMGFGSNTGFGGQKSHSVFSSEIVQVVYTIR